MFSNNDISRYYDLSEIHYRLFWNLEKSHSLHYGYWDETTKNFHEALLNINKVLATTACVNNAETVLDAGCGVGGSSVWLAKEKNCKVTGISLNEKQVQQANAFAKLSGVDEQVCFEQKDYMNTAYPDNSFDIVWAIESVCYADDKSRFIDEAFRILKDGGRLIMADFFKQKDLTEKEAATVKRWANGWAINDFATAEDFHCHLQQAGFREIKITDISNAIRPSAKRLYRSYFIGIAGAKLYRLFKGKATSLARNNVDTAYLQYITLKKGLWKYNIVCAVK